MIVEHQTNPSCQRGSMNPDIKSILDTNEIENWIDLHFQILDKQELIPVCYTTPTKKYSHPCQSCFLPTKFRFVAVFMLVSCFPFRKHVSQFLSQTLILKFKYKVVKDTWLGGVVGLTHLRLTNLILIVFGWIWIELFWNKLDGFIKTRFS